MKYNLPVLFMCYLGCKPQGRVTEQHDFFFSIGDTIQDIIPHIESFWPEAAATRKFHIDSYRQVVAEKGYIVSVQPREISDKTFQHEWRLFFVNLGGYKKGEFGEYHYPDLYIARDKAEAIDRAKETVFFKHCGYEGAPSHVDDKYGIDVDDFYDIEELLPAQVRNDYGIWITKAEEAVAEDEIHSGFQLLKKLKEKQ